MPAAKPDSLNPVPRTHLVEGEKRHLQAVLWPRTRRNKTPKRIKIRFLSRKPSEGQKVCKEKGGLDMFIEQRKTVRRGEVSEEKTSRHKEGSGVDNTV